MRGAKERRNEKRKSVSKDGSRGSRPREAEGGGVERSRGRRHTGQAGPKPQLGQRRFVAAELRPCQKTASRALLSVTDTRDTSVVTPHSGFSDTCYKIPPLTCHVTPYYSFLHLFDTCLSAAAEPRNAHACRPKQRMRPQAQLA